VPIFTTMLISTFNMIFTACPIVCYAVVEQVGGRGLGVFWHRGALRFRLDGTPRRPLDGV
jgi:hypothetical protein